MMCRRVAGILPSWLRILAARHAQPGSIPTCEVLRWRFKAHGECTHTAYTRAVCSFKRRGWRGWPVASPQRGAGSGRTACGPGGHARRRTRDTARRRGIDGAAPARQPEQRIPRDHVAGRRQPAMLGQLPFRAVQLFLDWRTLADSAGRIRAPAIPARRGSRRPRHRPRRGSRLPPARRTPRPSHRT